MKILVSWSTGKDSAWMLHMLQQQHPGAVAGLLTTTNEAFDRVAMHAVRRELLRRRPTPPACRFTSCRCRGRARTRSTKRAWARRSHGFVADGFTHVAFGDLFLEDVRRYREDRLAGSGLEPLFPDLENEVDRRRSRSEMIAGGLRARLTCVDPQEARSQLRRPRLRSRRCWPTCRPALIPAARTASSTRSRARGRCSATRSPFASGEVVERDGSSSPI